MAAKPTESDVEARVTALLAQLAREFEGAGEERDWLLVRAFIHRAVHHAVDGKRVEFCTLATYLSEMIGHAHKIAHGDNPKAQSHKDLVH
jgi:hypothetical protein